MSTSTWTSSGFNPCFCGTRARTLDQMAEHHGLVVFQSLFLWNSRPDPRIPHLRDMSVPSFQSLFLWNSRPDMTGTSTSEKTRMFQSLFLWNSRPDFPGEPTVAVIPLFQSLFLWNSRPDLTRPDDPRRVPRVSILVFVELAPGPDRDRGLMRRNRGFQSLFLWNSRPDLAKTITFWRSSSAFQSLFLWNSRPDEVRGCLSRPPRPVSILVFVELAPGRFASTSRAPKRPCFNPCFCGTRARTMAADRTVAFQSGFNPCFCGTRARTRRTPRRDASPSCFNPCFCGTRARTGIDGAGTTTCMKFQSLFLWNSRPDLLGRRGSLPPRDVSILVFVELAPGLYTELTRAITEMFQSLFLWNSRPDDPSGAVNLDHAVVSILVFVELAPGRRG